MVQLYKTRKSKAQSGSMMDCYINAFVVFMKVVLLTIVGMIKALIPYGYLPKKNVAGETVLITGSATGIGRLMAIEFGKLGCRLVLWDINVSGNEEVKKTLESQGVKVHSYTVNLTNANEIAETAKKVRDEIGDIDILINNAGVVTGKKFLESDYKDMKFVLDVNLNAVHYVTKEFLPRMVERNHGHVVVVASICGHLSIAGLVDYCASKHGAVGFGKSLYDEMKSTQRDVNVTIICPFYIDTGMFEGVQHSAPLCFPVLKPDLVVERTMEAILTNKVMLLIPRPLYPVVALYSILPYEAQHAISDYLGVHRTMGHFVGRR